MRRPRGSGAERTDFVNKALAIAVFYGILKTEGVVIYV